MPDDFPTLSLPAGGYKRDFASDLAAEPVKTPDPGPPDLALAEEVLKETSDLSHQKGDLEQVAEDMRWGGGYADLKGLAKLGWAALPGGPEFKWDPDLVTERIWDPRWLKSKTWKEQQHEYLDKVARNYRREGSSQAEIEAWLLSYALDPEKVNDDSDPENPLFVGKGKRNKDVANILNFYAMEKLGFRAEDTDDLYKNLAARQEKRDEVTANVESLVQNRVAQGNFDDIFVGTLRGQAVGVVPRFNQETNEELSNSMNDPVLRELYRVRVPARILRQSSKGWTDASVEDIKRVLPEGEWARATEKWENNRTAVDAFGRQIEGMEGLFARYAMAPLYESFDGRISVDFDEIEQGLILDYAEKRALDLGLNPHQLTPEQNQEINLWAENRASKEIAPIKNLGRGLVHHTDPNKALLRYNRGEGWFGRTAVLAGHLANLGWAINPLRAGIAGKQGSTLEVDPETGEYIKPPPTVGTFFPVELTRESLLLMAAQQGREDLVEELSQKDFDPARLQKIGNILHGVDIVTEVGKLLNALPPDPRPAGEYQSYSVPARFIKTWLATLMPTRRMAGAVTRGGKVVQYDRAEGLFGQMAADWASPDALVSNISPLRALDWIIRFAPSEALATSFVLARHKWADQDMDKLGLNDREKATWHALEMAQNMGQPRTLDRLTRQHLDAGTYFAEFGDAFFDWIPPVAIRAPWAIDPIKLHYGNQPLLSFQEKREEEEGYISLQDAIGASAVILQFGWEFDGILAGVYGYSGAKALARRARKAAGSRPQDLLGVSGYKLIENLGGPSLTSGARAEYDARFNAINWGKESERGFLRTQRFVRKVITETNAPPTIDRWKTALDNGEVNIFDFKSYIYGVSKMSEDVSGAGEAIFNLGVTRFFGSQGLSEGARIDDLLRMIQARLGDTTYTVDRNKVTLANRLKDIEEAVDERLILRESLQYIEDSKKVLIDELNIKKTAYELAAEATVLAKNNVKNMVQTLRILGMGPDLSKVDPKVARFYDALDDPDMLMAAMRVGRNEMPVEDFLKYYGDTLRKLGIKVTDEGFKEFVLTALTRYASEPAAVKGYRTLRHMTESARTRQLVYMQARRTYEAAKESLVEQITKQFESVGIRNPRLGGALGTPEAREVLAQVLAELKALEGESAVTKLMLSNAETILKDPNRRMARGMADLVDSLFHVGESSARQGKLDNADIKALADSWVGTGAEGFLRALAKPESRVNEAVRKFVGHDQGAAPGDLEKMYTAEKIRTTWADPDSAFHAFREQRLPQARRDLILATQRQAVNIASKRGFPSAAHNAEWYAAWKQWYGSRATWLAHVGINTQRTLSRYPVFNRWVKANPVEFHEDVQLAIRSHRRRMRGIDTTVNLLIEHAPDIDKAFDDILDFFSQGGGMHVISSKYAVKVKIPGVAEKVTLQKALPYLGVDKLTIGAIADLNESLIRLGLRELQGERFTYKGQAAYREAGLSPKTSEDSMIITSIIKAYIDENRAVRPKGDELAKLLENIREYVYRKFPWEELSSQAANAKTDKQLFNLLEKRILEGINLHGRSEEVLKESGGALFPVAKKVGGEMGARYADSREKHLRLLLAGASTELLDMSLRQSMGMKTVGADTADYMNFVNRDFRGADLAEMTASRSARPWAKGDWVVDMEETELFSALFRNLGDFKYHPGRDPGARIEPMPRAQPEDAPRQAKAGRPWWREAVGYKKEHEELHALWARYPEWEAAWKNDLGQAPAQQIVSVNEKARTVTLTNGEVRSFDTIARRDIRISWFDALDGSARWGFEAFATPGIKKRFNDQAKIVRNQHTAMVLRGHGPGGLKAMPYELAASMTEEIQKLTKVFDDWYNEVVPLADSSFLKKAMLFTKNTIQASLKAWRQSILFGIMIPRFAYVPIQWFQDAVNLSYYHGLEGAALSLVGGMSMVPYVGNVVQKHFFNLTARAARQGKLPGATFTSAFMDRNWNKFYAASDDVAFMEKGVPVTYRQLMAEAEMAGAREWIGLEDYNKAADTMANRLLRDRDAKNWYDHAVAMGTTSYRSIHRQFQIGIQDAVGRMRAVTYWYYRVHKRMSVQDAQKMLDRTLINWTDSVSEWEKKWFGSVFLFYTLHKNAFMQVADAFTEMSSLGRTLDEQMLNYANRYLTFSTRAQRLRLMSRYFTQPQQWAPSPVEEQTPEDIQIAAQRGDISSWLSKYPIIGMPQRASAGQMERYWRATGRKMDFIVPTLPLISQLEYLNSALEAAEMILAIPVYGLQLMTDRGEYIPYAVNPEIWTRESTEFVGSYMNPFTEAAMMGISSLAAGVPQPLSPYGRRAAVGNTETLDTLSRLGVNIEDSLIETYEYKGETRTRYRMGVLGWAAKEILVDRVGKESDMFRVYLGLVTGERDLSSAKIQALVETDEDFRVRAEAARTVFNLYRYSLISTEQERTARLKGQERYLRDLEHKSDLKLDEAWADYMKEVYDEEVEGITAPVKPEWLDE